MTPGKSTIFIIDDDASVRRALTRVMTQAGLPSEAYESAEAFLAATHQGDAGCIVADMTMPGMSGLELKILLDSAGLKLPLVLLTAQDTDETRAAARSAGAAAYFRKPVDIQALLDAVRWACYPANPGSLP
ncbi:response regulator [Luteolibacter arcticus]|uniref:Response regulator n=1 Tax=Luteolibacter arcticus TaxID=1581411 RepID=A0ABT3GJZ6_9BACT|nr:response regulator [Luteolibacter arcticus]MCW1923834.1 response regulator [Luteolibacter arcticus]